MRFSIPLLVFQMQMHILDVSSCWAVFGAILLPPALRENDLRVTIWIRLPSAHLRIRKVWHIIYSTLTCDKVLIVQFWCHTALNYKFSLIKTICFTTTVYNIRINLRSVDVDDDKVKLLKLSPSINSLGSVE